MRVLHVIPSINRRNGGPSRSCQGLIRAEEERGVDAWLYTVNHSDEPWISNRDKFVNSGDFAAALEKVQPDLVHMHSVWLWGMHRCMAICRRKGVPYIVAPRGMLEPWALKQGWLKKKIAWWMYLRKDLKCASALHATAVSEEAQFRHLGLKQMCIVSSNGVNLPDFDVSRADRENGRRRALFVSRMHPKKGVLELVEAWGKLCRVDRENAKKWDCELVYTVRSAEERAYEQKVKSRILELGMSYQDKDGTIHSSTSAINFNFILTGELDDEHKWEAYARADLFVLPTYSENFGIVVAESLWAGVPVITTKGTPWSELETEKCGWWIDIGVEPLVKALREAFPTSTCGLNLMGFNGRKLVEDRYTWPAVCDKMIKGYVEVLNGART